MSRLATIPRRRLAQTEVEVARGPEDLIKAFTVRWVVFVGEQRCPEIEEFDGNDYAGATHLLARSDGAIAGTCRVRWFASFAKIERVAVLPAFRGRGVARALIEAARMMAAAKGYERMLAHVEPELVAYWHEQGFEPRAGREAFHYSDRRYVEVLAEFSPDPRAIRVDTPPLVAVRPEGRWDEAGVLDHSARRAMT